MDLESLHANTPNLEGISAVKATYERYPETSAGTKVIIKFQFDS